MQRHCQLQYRFFPEINGKLEDALRLCNDAWERLEPQRVGPGSGVPAPVGGRAPPPFLPLQLRRLLRLQDICLTCVHQNLCLLCPFHFCSHVLSDTCVSHVRYIWGSMCVFCLWVTCSLIHVLVCVVYLGEYVCFLLVGLLLSDTSQSI